MDAERLVEAVGVQPILFENTQKSYKDAEKMQKSSGMEGRGGNGSTR